MGLANYVAARGNASEVSIVNHDELAIERFMDIQLDHAGAKSHGRCKRSGCVFQDVRRDVRR